jgi:hypothetical protein
MSWFFFSCPVFIASYEFVAKHRLPHEGETLTFNTQKQEKYRCKVPCRVMEYTLHSLPLESICDKLKLVPRNKLLRF